MDPCGQGDMQGDLERSDEEEEEIEEIPESEVIAMLDAEQDPHQRCVRILSPVDGAPAVLDALRSRGLFSDEETEPALALEVGSAARTAASTGIMAAGGKAGNDAIIRGDTTVMIDRDRAGSLGLGTAVAFFDELKRQLESAIVFSGEDGKAHCEYQLALYEPGHSGYGRHRDALPSSGSFEPPPEEGGVGVQRLVTAILYGADTGKEAEPWLGETHGGRLRAWLSEEANAEGAPMPVRMEPRGLVVFLSGAVDHDVEPVSAECADASRAALTCWFS